MEYEGDMSASEESRLKDDWRREWLRPVALAALLCSLALHTVLQVVAALIIFSRPGPEGMAPGFEEPVEFAVISAEDLAALMDEALEAEAPAIPDSALSEDVPQVELMEADVGAELEGLTADASEFTADLGGGDVTGGDLGLAGAGSGSATFFGVEATGNRFAYIADVSGSMSVENKIQELRAELSRSIMALMEHSRFAVVLFNEAAHPLGGEVKWTDATEGGKQWGLRWIERVQAGGGTNPLPAFEQVFALRPRPEAIYFMTDGEFDPLAADEIRKLNRMSDVPIHCICFRTRASEELMKRIARESGGRYSFVGGP